jgi:hypothetical protein
MATLIKYLHEKDLAIFRPEDEETPDKDMLFYMYNEIEEEEIDLEDLERDYGILLIKKMNKFLKDITKKQNSLIENIILEFEKDNTDKYKINACQLFCFLLFIKLALREIEKEGYGMGLTNMLLIIPKDEENIAYQFSQYLINEWGYNKKLEKDLLDILNDKERFIIYYRIIKDTLKGAKLNKEIIDIAYYNLEAIFIKNQKI